MSAVGIPVAVMAFAPPAAASTCSGNSSGIHYYTGQSATTYVYQGIEGYLSVDGISQNSAVDEINRLGGIQSAYDCVNKNLKGACSIQAGYGIGNVGGYQSSSWGPGLRPYMEEEDVNGYDVNWGGPSLAQNDYISVFYTNQISGYTGIWDAYINNGSGPVLVGQAYMPFADVLPAGESESEYFSNGTCATINQYEYYGTNGAGGVSGGTSVQLSKNGTSWASWTSDAGPVVSTNYVHSEMDNYYAYKGYGG